MCDEGLCRIGWATRGASLDIGTDRHSFGYGGTGAKSHQKKFETYGGAFGKGDVIGCCLDCGEKSISYLKNGEPLGKAFDVPQHLVGQVGLASCRCFWNCSNFVFIVQTLMQRHRRLTRQGAVCVKME